MWDLFHFKKNLKSNQRLSNTKPPMLSTFSFQSFLRIMWHTWATSFKLPTSLTFLTPSTFSFPLSFQIINSFFWEIVDGSLVPWSFWKLSRTFVCKLVSLCDHDLYLVSKMLDQPSFKNWHVLKICCHLIIHPSCDACHWSENTNLQKKKKPYTSYDTF